jgi:ankyrin repeat protein
MADQDQTLNIALEAETDMHGDAADCRAIIDQYAHLVNTPNEDMWTPLRLCVFKMSDANAAVHVAHLLALGADQNIRATKGSLAPIHEACRLGKIQTVRELLKADAHAVLGYETTARLYPIHYAASSGEIELVNYVLEQDPGQLLLLTEGGNTPLAYAGAYAYEHRYGADFARFEAVYQRLLALSGGQDTAPNNLGLIAMD